MTPSPIDLLDALGLLISGWFFLMVGALAGQTALALWGLASGRFSRFVKLVRMLAVTALGLAGLYLWWLIGDIPGVISILTNSYQDIPPESIGRTTTFAALLTLVWFALYSLTPPMRLRLPWGRR